MHVSNLTTPESRVRQAYLCYIAVWICPRIPVDLQNHSLHKLREFWQWKPVFWALARELWRSQNMKRHAGTHLPLKLYLQPSVAMQGYLGPYRSCGLGPQFPAVATLDRKPCGSEISGAFAVSSISIKVEKTLLKSEGDWASAPAELLSTRPRSRPSSSSSSSPTSSPYLTIPDTFAFLQKMFHDALKNPVTLYR